MGRCGCSSPGKGVLEWGMVVILAGCNTPPGDGVQKALPSYEVVAAAQNERIDQLSHLTARGVVELRWVDEAGGRHFEPQVNLDLWLRPPRETALRLEKMGEVLFWIGSDEERYWLFDLITKPTSVRTGRHDEATQASDDFFLPVRPESLLDLLGFIKLPESNEGTKIVPVEDKANTFRIVEEGRVIWFDASTLLPSRIEILNKKGRSILVSTLRRYEGVYLPGTFVLNRPRFPTLVDITGDEGLTSVKIALDSSGLTGDPEGQPWDRVFDYDRLHRALRPEVLRASAK